MASMKEVDKDAAQELDLFIENESSLYNQKKSIIENIKRKMASGKYDPSLAPKLWIYWVDNGARLYCKEHRCTLANTFSPATRVYVATEMAKHYEQEIKNGNYGAIPFKAPKLPKISLERIRLNSQGYTSRGQYYGTGAPLYSAFNPDNGEYLEFRASDRPQAMGLVKMMFTNPDFDMLSHKGITRSDIKRFTT